MNTKLILFSKITGYTETELEKILPNPISETEIRMLHFDEVIVLLSNSNFPLSNDQRTRLCNQLVEKMNTIDDAREILLRILWEENLIPVFLRRAFTLFQNNDQQLKEFFESLFDKKIKQKAAQIFWSEFGHALIR